MKKVQINCFGNKACKKLTDGLFEKMKAYTHKGPKDKEYKKYQLLNFIEKNIKDLTTEDIEQYSFVQSKLHRWMTTLIEMRKEDIHKRKEIKEKEREERDQAIEDHKEWKRKREEEMKVAKAEFETKQAEEEARKESARKSGNEGEGEQDNEFQEKPVFNDEEWFRIYDSENPEVIIPHEVIDDIDNDYEMPKGNE